MTTEAELISQMNEFWDSAQPEQKRLETRLKENLRFIVGQQWDPEDLQLLKEQGKPALTYNEILPKCNALVGEYLANMQQVQVYPRRGGVKTVANVLTHLAKHVMDLCDGDYEEAACFMEGLAGQSNLAWDINYDADPFNGDVQLRKVSAFRVIWDHEAREYNPNKSGRFVTEIWYWDEGQIKKAYPKKYDADGLVTDNQYNNENSYVDAEPALEDTYEEAKTTDGVIPNLTKKKHQIKCTHWIEFKNLEHLYDNGENASPPNLLRLNKQQIPIAQALMQNNPSRYKIIKRVVKVLHKTVYAGNIVFEDITDPLGLTTDFPLMRFCPYWIDGHIMGVIDNAKDPQRELNKRMSQTLHILNKIANLKYYAQKDESGAIDDIEGGEEIVKYKKEKPEQARPPTMPQGHFGMANINSEFIGRVMGIREPMEGMAESPNQSGVALLRLQQQGSKMARPILNNFKLTRKIVYEGIINLIRNSDVYSMAEIEQIVPEEIILDSDMAKQAAQRIGQPPQPPRQPNPAVLQYVQERSQAEPRYRQLLLAQQTNSQRQLEQYQQASQRYAEQLKVTAKQILAEQLKAWSTGRYGTKVSQQPLSDTLKLAYAQILIDLRKNGTAIPDDIIIESLDHPAGEKIIARMRQMAQAAPIGAE